MATVHAAPPAQRHHAPPGAPVPRWLLPVWVGYVGVALLALDVLSLTVWAVAALVAAAALMAVTAPRAPALSWLHLRADRLDLIVLAGLYAAVVGLFRLAFAGFTTDRVAGLFLAFAGGLILGVAGPLVYTTWVRKQPLGTLGLGRHRLRTTLTFALAFGGVQFVIMFWGYALPAPVDWVPLLVMSLTVGLFEVVAHGAVTVLWRLCLRRRPRPVALGTRPGFRQIG